MYIHVGFVGRQALIPKDRIQKALDKANAPGGEKACVVLSRRVRDFDAKRRAAGGI